MRAGFLPLINEGMTATTRRDTLPRRVFFLALCSAVLIIITGWAYAPGLYGPLLLDDTGSLTPLSAWLAGDISWRELLLGNPSGTFGRVIPMASFLVNAALSGDSVYALKVGNLLVHLLLGGLVFLAARAVLTHTALAPQRNLWAFAIAAVWLLHPLQLSTVLYVVQRMTQMSALFSLLAVILWFAARTRLAAGDRGIGRWLLFAGVPLATLLAALSKENGVLAPLLCIVLDFALFGWRTARPPEIRVFIGLTAVGGAAGVVWALSSGLVASLLSAYDIRDFTLAERLLTQPRILADYVGQWVWPDLARLGLYHDGFAISRGWFTPPTTAIAIIAWVAVLLGSLVLRRHAPLISAGLWFYLAGHLIESSAIGLELYFEHRNYLPNFGLALATVGLADAFARHGRYPIPDRAPVALIIILIPLLALATHAKATVWTNGERIAREGVAAHPQSIRAWTDLASAAMQREDSRAAHAALESLASLSNPEAQRVAVLFQIFTDCLFENATRPERLQKLKGLVDGRLTLFLQQSAGLVVDRVSDSPCAGIDAETFADILLEFVQSSPLSDRHFVKWRLRYHAARMLVEEGRFGRAVEFAEPAWAAGVRDPALAATFAFALAQTARPDEARDVIDEVLLSIRPSHPDRVLLEAMRARLEPS